MLEVEKKYRVTQEEFSNLKEILGKLNPEYHDEMFEENILFANDETPKEKVFRIRNLKSVAYGNHTLFTYKERVSKEKGLKVAEETEFFAPEGPLTIVLTKGLGLEPSLVYEKRRQELTVGAAKICFDELPFGYFIEIEGTEPAIKVLEEFLHLEDKVEERSYPQLTKEEWGGNNEARFLG